VDSGELSPLIQSPLFSRPRSTVHVRILVTPQGARMLFRVISMGLKVHFDVPTIVGAGVSCLSRRFSDVGITR
jgi:hypothetical protein